ncbi:DUF1353 domain-containing protein [Brevundimonas sp.]|uniref:DUF1353 domain-containing protein n=1 Tax=Brevundimonas sp. TaxID=1871086 RepID=UPI00289BF1AC|nr:DUF1353 domain-containing protein [Brevundimonas sp.]
MSRFTAATYDLTADRKGGRPVVCLTSPLTYEVGYLGSGWAVTAPVGFCSDLASMPSWTQRFRWGRRLAGKLARSAIVHDLLRSDLRVGRIKGDLIFFEAMGVDRVRLAWRLVALAGVLTNGKRQ